MSFFDRLRSLFSVGDSTANPSDTWTPDGEGVAIPMLRNENRYASVFLSKNKKRLGIRLENASMKPTVWVDSRLARKFGESFLSLAEQVEQHDS